MLKDVVVTYKGKYLGTYRGPEKELKNAMAMFALQSYEHEESVDILLDAWEAISSNYAIRFCKNSKIDLDNGLFNE